MIITMEIIKEYFGDIDLTDDLLVKKTYKQLAKKFHPDITGDDKKFKEIRLCFDRIHEIQPELKIFNDLQSLKKDELENSLKNVDRDLFNFKAKNDVLMSNIKDINNELYVLKNSLKESFLYFLFNGKSKKKKIANFFFLFSGLHLAILMLMIKFNFNIPAMLVTFVFSTATFIWLFRKNMIKINNKKTLISKYLREKEDLDYEISRLEKRICSLEIKKLAILKKIEELKEQFKVVS